MVLNPFLFYLVIIFYNKPLSTQWLQINNNFIWLVILWLSWSPPGLGLGADSCWALSRRVDNLGLGAHVVPGGLSAEHTPSSPPPSPGFLPRCVRASKHNTSFCLCHSYWYFICRGKYHGQVQSHSREGPSTTVDTERWGWIGVTTATILHIFLLFRASRPCHTLLSFGLGLLTLSSRTSLFFS